MRVTNGMIINTTLGGLYKNMNAINKTYAQMVTGKKIQTVSDDPIIAGRALKLKTSVLETSQYEGNIKEANAWMEVTEGALKNINDIIETIRTKCVEAATGTLEKKDKEIILEEIGELTKQLQEEANVSYGGRYIFSGYKTNEPLMLRGEMLLKEDCALEAPLYLGGEVNLEKGTVLEGGTTLAKGSVLGSGTPLNLSGVLPKGTILSAEDAQELLGVTTTEENYVLENEMPLPGDKDGYILKKEMTLGGQVALQKAITVDSKITLETGSQLAKGSTLKGGTKLPAGTLNPKVNGKIEGQGIDYEIGTNSSITVNTLGMDCILSDLIDAIGEMTHQVAQSLEDETITGADLHQLFDKKLEEMDEILLAVSEATTSLGSRMNRVSYVENRLTEQKTTLKSLLSDTEDVDIEEVYVTFNTQYAAYQSALQATSKIITNTLADYL